MKGLKKVALASAIAAVSAGAQAELKALDDSAMGELTGQAGLTIDVETGYTIGEFAYHDTDGGFVVIEDIALGGNSNDKLGSALLDNFRMTIDVAGDNKVHGVDASGNIVLGGEKLTYGFSEVKGLANAHIFSGNADTNFGAVSSGINPDTGNAIDEEKEYGDGDLVIHFGFTDAWEKGGGFAAFRDGTGESYDGTTTGLSLASVTWEQAKEVALRAVDFSFSIGKLGLAASTEAGNIGSFNLEDQDDLRAGIAGFDPVLDTAIVDSTPETTTLLSNINFRGYLGPEDLWIQNNGNGFSGGANGAGTGAADSKIVWGSYFNVTDLDLYIDIAGVQLSDIKIHNSRGDLTGLDSTDSFGFAHSERTIYAVNEDVIAVEQYVRGTAGYALAVGTGGPLEGALALGLVEGTLDANNGYTDGVAINTEFKGDLDIGALSFGDDDTSIGSIYLTDIDSTTNWTISAH